MFWPDSKNEWSFGGTIAAQAVSVLALEIYILTQWQTWVHPNVIQVPISYTVPCDLAILVFACVYLAILSLDAIHSRNNILLFAICLGNCLTVVFSAMQYKELLYATHDLPAQRDGFNQPLVNINRDIWPYVQPAELAAITIIGICTPVICYFAYQLHKEYSWTIYRKINGDSSIKIRYLAYEIFLVLIKLNLFFLIAFIVQYDLIDVHFDEPEYALTLALIPAAFLVMILGIWCVRKEYRYAMAAIIICYLALIAYLLSRIIILCGHTFRANTAGKDKMLLFAIASLIFTFCSVVCAIQCFLNFDHGLKSIISSGGKGNREPYHFHHIPSPVGSIHNARSSLE